MRRGIYRTNSLPNAFTCNVNNESMLYLQRYSKYPSSIFIEHTIDFDLLLKKINDTYLFTDVTVEHLHGFTYESQNKYFWYDKTELMIYVSSNLDKKEHEVTFLFSSREVEDQINKIIGEHILKEKTAKNKIYFIVNAGNSFDLKSFKVAKVNVDIDQNYNDDFKEVNKIILKRLKAKNDKGIVLLNSDPGIGKSTYIRYLTTQINKKFIFISPDMANVIASPNFIPFLSEHPNSILVIEDAENVLRERDEMSSQAVSNLLNLSDGLLSDALSIQVIATFNCDVSKIDSALMRKGRLIARHKFDKLSVYKSNKLLKKLNIDMEAVEPMSLADIFNANDKDFKQDSVKKIGFR